jgi:hypothetical protein
MNKSKLRIREQNADADRRDEDKRSAEEPATRMSLWALQFSELAAYRSETVVGVLVPIGVGLDAVQASLEIAA